MFGEKENIYKNIGLHTEHTGIFLPLLAFIKVLFSFFKMHKENKVQNVEVSGIFV